MNATASRTAGYRDLVKLINEGKPLPEKYRFILFDEYDTAIITIDSA